MFKGQHGVIDKSFNNRSDRKRHTSLGVKCIFFDLNQGGSKQWRPLLEFPMRTAMHGKSRVSSAISVCDN